MWRCTGGRICERARRAPAFCAALLEVAIGGLDVCHDGARATTARRVRRAMLLPGGLRLFWRGMAKKKKSTQVLRLVSQAGTGFFYTLRKAVRPNAEKLQLMKHDPIVNQHVLFTEKKVRAQTRARERRAQTRGGSHAPGFARVTPRAVWRARSHSLSLLRRCHHQEEPASRHWCVYKWRRPPIAPFLRL